MHYEYGGNSPFPIEMYTDYCYKSAINHECSILCLKISNCLYHILIIITLNCGRDNIIFLNNKHTSNFNSKFKYINATM